MSSEGIWVVDPATGEETFKYYWELEEETKSQLIKPIGGFCWKAGEFLQLNLPSVPYYIKDWLPKQGKAAIYAPQKSGKSFLAVQAARCIGAGEEFMGIPTTQGRVLYVQSELGAEVLQGRMESTKESYEDVYVGTTFSMKLDQDGGQNLLRNALESIEPDVLILDPFYKMIRGDEDESHDMMPVLDFLDKEVIELYHCSILIIDHPGKDIRKGMRGTSVKEDWVDSAIEMKKTSKKGEPLRAKLTAKLLRHAAEPPESLEVRMTNFEFEPVEFRPTVKQEVEKYLQEHEVVKPKEIIEAGLGSNASVYKAINTLIAEGKVKRKERGEYTWNA